MNYEHTLCACGHMMTYHRSPDSGRVGQCWLMVCPCATFVPRPDAMQGLPLFDEGGESG